MASACECVERLQGFATQLITVKRKRANQLLAYLSWLPYFPDHTVRELCTCLKAEHLRGADSL